MSNSGLENPPPEEGQRARRFFVGVLWNWVGVSLNIAIGLLLSPYIARKLGSERYGIWALVFSLVEFLWFFDLGFNCPSRNSWRIIGPGMSPTRSIG